MDGMCLESRCCVCGKLVMGAGKVRVVGWEAEEFAGPDGKCHLGYPKELGSYCKLSREVIGDCMRDTLRWDMGMILARMESDSEKISFTIPSLISSCLELHSLIVAPIF